MSFRRLPKEGNIAFTERIQSSARVRATSSDFLYTPPSPADWISPNGPFYSMKGRPGNLAAFLAPSEGSHHAKILEARRHLLRASPERHGCWEKLGEDRWKEAVEAGRRADLALPETPLAFSETFEPDWIWVDRSGGEPLARGSSVCFPSGWAPDHITGKSVAKVHAVVPDLNATLGGAIQRFLERLKVDQAWERFNWGLAPDDRLNRHPDRSPPRLGTIAFERGEFHLRTEHHLFWALSDATVLFFIRVHHHPFRELSPELQEAIRRQVEAMTPELRTYKGIPVSSPKGC